jgi:hypothetical protein
MPPTTGGSPDTSIPNDKSAEKAKTADERKAESVGRDDIGELDLSGGDPSAASPFGDADEPGRVGANPTNVGPKDSPPPAHLDPEWNGGAGNQLNNDLGAGVTTGADRTTEPEEHDESHVFGSNQQDNYESVNVQRNDQQALVLDSNGVKDLGQQILKNVMDVVRKAPLDAEDQQIAQRAADELAFCAIASVGASDAQKHQLKTRADRASATLVNMAVGKAVTMKQHARTAIYSTIQQFFRVALNFISGALVAL